MQIYELICELASFKKYSVICSMKPRILIIGLVWPEPTSSAAGWRMLQLIDQLLQWTDDIHFASAATKSAASYPLNKLSVTEHEIVLNDSSFNDFVSDLKPDVVVYDRFVTEEQFGWRVKQVFPELITVLDTEDLHFVRRARAVAFKNQTDIDYDTPDCYRELSAMYRCDLSLIISDFEYNLLVNHFNIPEKQLLYLPFIEKELSVEIQKKIPGYSDRQHVMFIGNFIHEPNYQTVLQLKRIWAALKKRLPQTELHIYGAYPPEKVYQLHNVSDRFLIKGKAINVDETMQKYRVLAAPIPFGAGLKGKFVDGFKNGLPNVTTAMGCEGMNAENWGGLIAENDECFIEAVCHLYTDETIWQQSVTNGFEIINEKFADKIWNGVLEKSIMRILKNRLEHRNKLIVQKILWQNSLQATKYMSLWIEQKNNK